MSIRTPLVLTRETRSIGELSHSPAQASVHVIVDANGRLTIDPSCS